MFFLVIGVYNEKIEDWENFVGLFVIVNVK